MFNLHNYLLQSPQPFRDFALRHRITDEWRLHYLYQWYLNQTDDNSKFAQVEYSGVLHIDEHDNVHVATASKAELDSASKRWQNLRVHILLQEQEYTCKQKPTIRT